MVDPNEAYAEILRQLREIRSGTSEGRPAPISLIDPTANVKSLVDLESKHASDIRVNDKEWAERLRVADIRWADRLRATEDKCKGEESELREKLVIESRKAVDSTAIAEARRIDAMLTEIKGAVALAAKEAAATAATLANTFATTMTTANDRMARMEQQQYQTGGRDLQREVGQGQSNVNRGQLMTIVIAVIGWSLALAGLAITVVLFALRQKSG